MPAHESFKPTICHPALNMNPYVEELLSTPLWRPCDLGKPLPNSPHAVSVCLPTWKDNIGYEEGEERVMSKLRAGYPRFVLNPLVVKLFAHYEQEICRKGEFCRIFPSEASAKRCLEFIRGLTGVFGSTHSLGSHNLHAAVLPDTCRDLAHLYWQHSGEIVSSRLAETVLSNKAAPQSDAAKIKIKSRLSNLYGAPESNIFLFPSGMAAIYCINRVAWRLFPGRRSVQFGFPYVDTLKIQQNLGPGAFFYPSASGSELGDLKGKLDKGLEISALFTEFPSNPLLVSPDMKALRKLSFERGFPLVIDDTLSTCLNVDLLPRCDVITSSLTKYFSGGGDVIGGAAILNPNSPFLDALKKEMDALYEDLFWSEDAEILEANSACFEERMNKINTGCESIFDYLIDHPLVEAAYYPKISAKENYCELAKPGGGYGGLLSFTLKNEIVATPKFFDALEISKGPNLGTAFSLCCPYTILAHYNELDFVKTCGLSKHLIRLSVGVESPENLINRFERAFSA